MTESFQSRLRTCFTESKQSGDPLTILCVCKGNYFRSPAMEAVLNHFIKERNLQKAVRVLSRGIYAPLSKPDPRSDNLDLRAALNAEGIAGSYAVMVGLDNSDLFEADLVLVSDQTVFNVILEKAKKSAMDSADLVRKLFFFADLDPAEYKGQRDMPDPQMGEAAPLEMVQSIRSTVEHKILPLLNSP